MNRLLGKSPIAWRRAAKYHHACGDNKEFFPENAALPIFLRSAPSRFITTAAIMQQLFIFVVSATITRPASPSSLKLSEDADPPETAA
jgi:hypothetical protein